MVKQISPASKHTFTWANGDSSARNHAAFADAKVLFEQVKAQHAQPRDWDTGFNHGMGMSGDLDAAIAAGSTMVRVGTALFGARG